MRTVTILLGLLGLTAQAYSQHDGHSMPHEMQHGFVLAADDKFASHLVATGHHSRQTEILGQLTIEDVREREIYQERKELNVNGGSYFLFQAQDLDLPSLQAGRVLTGHIVESKTGNYEPKNVIVKKASYRVDTILLNIENPFFGESH